MSWVRFLYWSWVGCVRIGDVWIMTENVEVKEYPPRKVVSVGNSIALILPSEWRKILFEQNAYGVWRIVTDKDGNQRIEVIFQKGR